MVIRSKYSHFEFEDCIITIIYFILFVNIEQQQITINGDIDNCIFLCLLYLSTKNQQCETQIMCSAYILLACT